MRISRVSVRVRVRDSIRVRVRKVRVGIWISRVLGLVNVMVSYG